MRQVPNFAYTRRIPRPRPFLLTTSTAISFTTPTILAHLMSIRRHPRSFNRVSHLWTSMLRPGMRNCSNEIHVNLFTRPFTDVSPNQDGSCTGIPAQDNSGDQAGVGNLFKFEAVYQASITVPAEGQLQTTIYADDGFIFSIGQDNNGDQPTPYPHNVMKNPPPGNVSPFDGFEVMGANNKQSRPASFTLNENIPSAGTYLISWIIPSAVQAHLRYK